MAQNMTLGVPHGTMQQPGALDMAWPSMGCPWCHLCFDASCGSCGWGPALCVRMPSDGPPWSVQGFVAGGEGGALGDDPAPPRPADTRGSGGSNLTTLCLKLGTQQRPKEYKQEKKRETTNWKETRSHRQSRYRNMWANQTKGSPEWCQT